MTDQSLPNLKAGRPSRQPTFLKNKGKSWGHVREPLEPIPSFGKSGSLGLAWCVTLGSDYLLTTPLSLSKPVALVPVKVQGQRSRRVFVPLRLRAVTKIPSHTS